MSRMIFLTAGYGEGHNAAARALADAAERRFGPGTAKVIDVFAQARPLMNGVSRKAYLGTINRAPGLWRVAYGWLDRSPRAPNAFSFLKREIQVLQRVIEREAPEVLCSTYPVYAYLLAAIRREYAGPLPPHYNVVTDSITINSLWWRAGCAGWFVPNEDSASVLRMSGVDRGRVHALGFPVPLSFSERPADLLPPDISQGGRPRVLYIVNSRTKAAAETARRLLAEERWDVTCAVGRNAALEAELVEISRRRSRPARILGWTSEIPMLLMTHHVLVTKAGGATIQEALAARCPVIVSQVVPGQEEGNSELVRRYNAGVIATRPELVMSELAKAFAGNAEIWRQWRAGVTTLSRPRAATKIVDFLAAAVAKAAGDRSTAAG